MSADGERARSLEALRCEAAALERLVAELERNRVDARCVRRL